LAEEIDSSEIYVPQCYFVYHKWTTLGLNPDIHEKILSADCLRYEMAFGIHV
jgi:hypothetical protein